MSSLGIEKTFVTISTHNKKKKKEGKPKKGLDDNKLVRINCKFIEVLNQILKEMGKLQTQENVMKFMITE